MKRNGVRQLVASTICAGLLATLSIASPAAGNQIEILDPLDTSQYSTKLIGGDDPDRDVFDEASAEDWDLGLWSLRLGFSREEAKFLESIEQSLKRGGPVQFTRISQGGQRVTEMVPPEAEQIKTPTALSRSDEHPLRKAGRNPVTIRVDGPLVVHAQKQAKFDVPRDEYRDPDRSGGSFGDWYMWGLDWHGAVMGGFPGIDSRAERRLFDGHLTMPVAGGGEQRIDVGGTFMVTQQGAAHPAVWVDLVGDFQAFLDATPDAEGAPTVSSEGRLLVDNKVLLRVEGRSEGGKTVSKNWGGNLGVELEAGKDKDGWSGTGTVSAGGSLGGESSAETSGPAIVQSHEVGRLCVMVGRPVSWRFYATLLARKPKGESSGKVTLETMTLKLETKGAPCSGAAANGVALQPVNVIPDDAQPVDTPIPTGATIPDQGTGVPVQQDSSTPIPTPTPPAADPARDGTKTPGSAGLPQPPAGPSDTAPIGTPIPTTPLGQTQDTRRDYGLIDYGMGGRNVVRDPMPPAVGKGPSGQQPASSLLVTTPPAGMIITGGGPTPGTGTSSGPGTTGRQPATIVVPKPNGMNGTFSTVKPVLPGGAGREPALIVPGGSPGSQTIVVPGALPRRQIIIDPAVTLPAAKTPGATLKVPANGPAVRQPGGAVQLNPRGQATWPAAAVPSDSVR